MLLSLPHAGLLAVLGLAISSAAAGTTTYNPTIDAFVDSANPGNNYGAAGSLGISAPSSAKGEFDAFIQFDLADLAGREVQAVSLQLTVMEPRNDIFNESHSGTFSARWLKNGSFIEGFGTPSIEDIVATHVNFNNHLNYLGADDEFLGAFVFDVATTVMNLQFFLTPGFLAEAQAGRRVTFYFSAVDTEVSLLVNSTNFKTGPASSKPILTVVSVPEPGPCWLAAAGSLSMVRRKRRLPHG